MSELWTVRHVAAHLEISRKRVYQLLESGKLECMRMGPRQTRVTRESVEKYVKVQIEHERRERGLDIVIGPGAKSRG